MKNMRGQVAMEYLATYGWAIVAMFIVLAFLVTSGVFNPNRFVSEECTFSPQLACGSFFVYGNTTTNSPSVIFNLTNSFGFPIFIINGSGRLGNNVSVCDQTTNCGSLFLDQGNTSGEIIFAFPPQSGKISENDLERIYVNFTFRNCQDLPNDANPGDCQDPAYNPNYPWHTVSGRIVAFVRTGP